MLFSPIHAVIDFFLVIFKHCGVSERKLYGKASGVETEEVLEVGSALGSTIQQRKNGELTDFCQIQLT